MTPLSAASFWHRVFPVLWMLGGVLAWGIADQAHGDVKLRAGDGKRKKDTFSVPEARAVTGSFVAGQSVDIELVGAVGSLRQTDFVIREAPKHGTLTNLRPHPKESNKAIVTYTHLGGQAGLQDSFKYACQVGGSGPYSAPALVSLFGQRIEPILSVTSVPNFGKVFLGGESSGNVTVRNMGRGPYLMNMVWAEGWTGPNLLEVKPGETATIQLTFRPVKPGVVRHEVELQPGVPSSKLVLFGEGVRALTVSPGYLAMDYDSKTGGRTGLVTLANGRSEAVKATLKYPMRLLAPTEVEIPALQKVEVLLQLPKTDVPKFVGEVVIEAAGVTERVAVNAAAKPAELKIVSPERLTLDFGQVAQNSAADQDIILGNMGGVGLVVAPSSRPPYTVEQAGKALRLDPGQQRSLKVSLNTDRPGNAIGELRISGGSEEKIIVLKAFVQESKPVEMPVVAETRPESFPRPAPSDPSAPPAGGGSAPVQPPAPLPAPTGPAPAPKPVQAEVADAPAAAEAADEDFQMPARKPSLAVLAALLGSEGLPMASSEVNPHLDRVTDIELVERKTSAFTIAWKKPGVAPAGWALEASSFVKDEENDIFVKRWKRLNHWKTLEGDADKVVARVHSLRPATQYELRIRGVDRDGKFSEPSPAFVVTTPEPWRVPPWVWRSLMIVALLVVIYMLYRARRGDFEFA